MELKHKSFFILIAIILGIGIGFLIWRILSPAIGRGVFYYQVEGDKANLFLLKNSHSGKKIVSLPAREIDPGDFRPPKRSYVSNSRKEMVYFKQVAEVPIEGMDVGEGMVAMRVVYKPILVNLKNNQEKEINQPMDSVGLVFSPDDSEIAWIKQIDEATYQKIEESGKKRELWISKPNGDDARLLASFDENVVLLQRWAGDFIYFQGLWDVTNHSMGRINVKTKEVQNMIPQYCEEYLQNCKNIEFSPSGNKFLYEIVSEKDGKNITELYLGDFDKKEFLAILTTDVIGDRLWIDDGEKFFYTEQETDKNGIVVEKIHLVEIKNQTDDTLYQGSYISELTFDTGGRYLYFLEKQKEGENFDLKKLDLKTKESKIILTNNYNKILLIR